MMWISKAEYTALVAGKAAAESTVQWLTVRLNQTEHMLGQIEYARTGRTSLVPTIEHARTVKPNDEAFDGFEDVGDDDARRLGVDTDAQGRVAFAG